jgi:hypothetical protein
MHEAGSLDFTFSDIGDGISRLLIRNELQRAESQRLQRILVVPKLFVDE